jgi:hypothetical protein
MLLMRWSRCDSAGRIQIHTPVEATKFRINLPRYKIAVVEVHYANTARIQAARAHVQAPVLAAKGLAPNT